MLTFTLKKEWYDKIRSGEKTVEYREMKSYWTKRFSNVFWRDPLPQKVGCFISSLADNECVLRLGYTKRQMTADITKIEVVDGKHTDLHVDKPVYALHLANVREING